MLLDRLVFLNHENVTVISISNNSTTGLVEVETNTLKTAMKWFWIRPTPMLQIDGELETFSPLVDVDHSWWSDIQHLRVNGSLRILCSVLTDALQKWDLSDQKILISKFHQSKLSFQTI